MSVAPQSPPIRVTPTQATLSWADLDAVRSFLEAQGEHFVDHLAGRGTRYPRGRVRLIRRRLEAVLDREL